MMSAHGEDAPLAFTLPTLRVVVSHCALAPMLIKLLAFFFSSSRRHTRYWRDWSSDVCSSDLGRLKRWTASLFYRLLRRLTAVDIPADVGDFRLVDRKALDAFRAMPERDRFVRGMFGWMGFRQTAVPFHREARAAGRSKYGWLRMTRLARDGLVGFSDVPLRLALWLGAVVSLSALVYGAYVVALAMRGDAHLVSGWASTIAVVTLLAGANLLTTGIVGLYVGRIHAEVKRRPLYMVARSIGFDREPQVVPASL